MNQVKSEQWQQLRASFYRRLAELRYSKHYMKSARNILNRLENFMIKRQVEIYSARVGEEFMTHEQNLISQKYHTHEKAVLHRLDDFCADRIFQKFSSFISPQCPQCFREYYESYIEDLKLRGKRPSTIERYRKICITSLISFHRTGIYRISDITPQHILKEFMTVNDKPVFVTVLRGFLKWLYKAGFHEKDLSGTLPAIRRPQLIPSVYTKTETSAMIAEIDRMTNIGQRDYAVILLALKLGMRRGDIAKLRFEDVDFETKRIKFDQEKTGVLQELFLPHDVELALNGYIQTARPQSDLPYIFVTARAPIKRIYGTHLYQAVAKNLKRAGIDNNNRKCGPHSLRMTLASELIAEEVPYAVVTHILGQEDPDSTRHYIQFDIEILRTCALEVPEVTGLLAESLDIVREA